MKRYPAALLLFLAMNALFSKAYAAGSETGSIQPDWNVYHDGYIFFYLDGTHAGSPCQITERWSFDAKTERGKALFSAFLMAYSTGRQVHVLGTGTCVHDNTEEVTNFYVR